MSTSVHCASVTVPLPWMQNHLVYTMLVGFIRVTGPTTLPLFIYAESVCYIPLLS
jgi:hypothetical protein